jgi:hypothetical protein
MDLPDPQTEETPYEEDHVGSGNFWRLCRRNFRPNTAGSISGWKYTSSCNPGYQKSDCAR